MIRRYHVALPGFQDNPPKEGAFVGLCYKREFVSSGKGEWRLAGPEEDWKRSVGKISSMAVTVYGNRHVDWGRACQ